jgi:uncharacterized glyoxalase superfamily protein PhnB
VDDADAAYAHATSLGATAKQKPDDQFFGDRSGTLGFVLNQLARVAEG